MPKAIAAPIEKVFKLEKFDPTGETTVTIRQATQGQHEKRSVLFDDVTRIYNDANAGEVKVQQRVSYEELKRTEIALTMCECNILGLDGTSSLFAFSKGPGGRSTLAMGEAAFIEAFNQLTPETVEEIHDCVRKVNVQWGPAGN